MATRPTGHTRVPVPQFTSARFTLRPPPALARNDSISPKAKSIIGRPTSKGKAEEQVSLKCRVSYGLGTKMGAGFRGLPVVVSNRGSKLPTGRISNIWHGVTGQSSVIPGAPRAPTLRGGNIYTHSHPSSSNAPLATPVSSVDAERAFSSERLMINRLQYQMFSGAFQSQMAIASWFAPNGWPRSIHQKPCPSKHPDCLVAVYPERARPVRLPAVTPGVFPPRRSHRPHRPHRPHSHCVMTLIEHAGIRAGPMACNDRTNVQAGGCTRLSISPVPIDHKALLNKNAKVYLAAHNKSGADDAIEWLKSETNGKAPIFLELDLGNLASVRKAVEGFNGIQQGTGVACIVQQRTGIVWETLGTDASSIVACKKLGTHTLYAQSKLGNVLFSNELARRYVDHGIISSSLNPASYGALTQLWSGTTPDGNNHNGKMPGQAATMRNWQRNCGIGWRSTLRAIKYELPAM
ncbi:hAT family dimerization domain-containing protein [Rhizoctonia solani AG-1 IA]|uniref:HAT family dimerization domain-containing protein n=1 Tax=Thanatephorus cucumeris (strain AG1-IA) TaxID=983506 RepID=L8X167_THACA|nr:hAT family dimerization domain-containing protein [Rhizoctonia solani AG-1 IA]